MSTPTRASRVETREARLHAILDAAVHVIADVGAGRATHRLIAERTDMRPGLLTYYFPTLRELHAAAFAQVTRDAADDAVTWSREIAADVRPARAAAHLVGRLLADRPGAVRAGHELRIAAARDEALLPLSGAHARARVDALLPIAGTASAPAAAWLVDGTLLHAITTGSPVDVDALERALQALRHP